MTRLNIYRSTKPAYWIHVEKIYDIIQWAPFIPVSQPHNFNKKEGWPRSSVEQWVRFNVLDWSAHQQFSTIPEGMYNEFVAWCIIAGAHCILWPEENNASILFVRV